MSTSSVRISKLGQMASYMVNTTSMEDTTRSAKGGSPSRYIRTKYKRVPTSANFRKALGLGQGLGARDSGLGARDQGSQRSTKGSIAFSRNSSTSSSVRLSIAAPSRIGR